jgi:hypothetical protein
LFVCCLPNSLYHDMGHKEFTFTLGEVGARVDLKRGAIVAVLGVAKRHVCNVVGAEGLGCALSRADLAASW